MNENYNKTHQKLRLKTSMKQQKYFSDNFLHSKKNTLKISNISHKKKKNIGQ